MSFANIVCPYNELLLETLKGHTVAVRVNDPAHAGEAAACVRRSRNTLACVIVEASCPVDIMGPGDGLKGVPLAVMSPSLGKLRNLWKHVKKMRELNLRIYLSCDSRENITGLRILSSLGLHGCAIFGNRETDWDATADLMTYAVLERAYHVPIEPFSFIASHYDPHDWIEWGHIWFDDPRYFLHLDEQGRVALSAMDLEKGRFIAQELSEIPEPSAFPAIRDRVNAWKSLFIQNHACASCAGWKICRGRFAGEVSGDRDGCSAFFVELIEVCRQYKAGIDKAEESRIWQL